MTSNSKPPSVNETAFDCPHCGAFTTQDWFKLYADIIEEESHRTPFFPMPEMRDNVLAARELDDEAKQNFLSWVDKMDTGLVFFQHNNQGAYLNDEANNLYISQCYNCKKIAVWVHDRLIFPHQKIGVNPNTDLPENIIRDFEEARDILNQSPRGAAALLRLCVQKLCAHLGEKGKNIDDDVACLVSKGLNPLVQKSLDVVRVIGNEAVHPGTIDIKDDRDTALKLLQILNVIADQMISHPKTIQQMYDQLPESKKKAIEDRNEKAKK